MRDAGNDRERLLADPRLRIKRMSPTWTTRDGREVPIADMGDSHLANTIRYLRRNREGLVMNAVLAAWRYSEHAPDGASGAAEMGAEHLMEYADDEEQLEQVVPQYRALVREAKRRKLAV